MNPKSQEEAAALWVEALRSGRFPQGRGRLTTLMDGERRYCCLGVACELYVQHVDLTFVNDAYFGRVYGNSYTASLPDEVRDWLGLRTGWGDFGWTPHEHEESLAALNDVGVSFNEIANMIEARVPGLFEK